MASVTYNSFWHDLCLGRFDFSIDTVYGLLVTSTYTPNKSTHSRRSNITNEATGTGYTPGGQAVTVALTQAGDTVQLQFGDVSWYTSTITARGIVLYKRRGGLATADELICYGDLGGAVSSVGSTLLVTNNIPIVLNNFPCT